MTHFNTLRLAELHGMLAGMFQEQGPVRGEPRHWESLSHSCKLYANLRASLLDPVLSIYLYHSAESHFKNILSCNGRKVTEAVAKYFSAARIDFNFNLYFYTQNILNMLFCTYWFLLHLNIILKAQWLHFNSPMTSGPFGTFLLKELNMALINYICAQGIDSGRKAMSHGMNFINTAHLSRGCISLKRGNLFGQTPANRRLLQTPQLQVRLL